MARPIARPKTTIDNFFMCFCPTIIVHEASVPRNVMLSRCRRAPLAVWNRRLRFWTRCLLCCGIAHLAATSLATSIDEARTHRNS